MAVRTHYDIDYDVAVLAAIVILQSAIDDLEVDVSDIAAALAIVDAVVDAILVDTTLIEAVTSALPTLSETGGTVTTDGTEQDVYINATPLGVFNPICVKIDCREQQAGDTIIIRQYSQGAAGASDPVLEDELEFAGVIAPHKKIIVDLDPNRFGAWITIERTGGAARAYPWEAFYEI